VLLLAGLALLAWAQSRRRLPPGSDPMLEALHAPAPNPALASKLQTYGRFVGSWTVDIDWHPPAARRRATPRANGTSPGCSTAAPSRTSGSSRRAGCASSRAVALLRLDHALGTTRRSTPGTSPTSSRRGHSRCASSAARSARHRPDRRGSNGVQRRCASSNHRADVPLDRRGVVGQGASWTLEPRCAPGVRLTRRFLSLPARSVIEVSARPVTVTLR